MVFSLYNTTVSDLSGPMASCTYLLNQMYFLSWGHHIFCHKVIYKSHLNYLTWHKPCIKLVTFCHIYLQTAQFGKTIIHSKTQCRITIHSYFIFVCSYRNQLLPQHFIFIHHMCYTEHVVNAVAMNLPLYVNVIYIQLFLHS